MLQVPAAFNRNSATVSSLMPAEESGRWLLERMQHQLGFADLSNVSLLDFGCGVRFTQALLNLGLPIGRYVGVDCFADMIEFLRASVADPRFEFHRLDIRHPLYNPNGAEVLGPDTRLPLPEHAVDVAAMFSVVTHQTPEAAGHLLALLRRYVRPEGRLFFTCFLDDTIAAFEDRSPEKNGGRCVFHPDVLLEIVRRAGWLPVARYEAEVPLIADSFVCRLAPVMP
jgi:SAM-dependent methyltransferase